MCDERETLPSATGDVPEAPPVTQAQAEELDRRVQAYRQNPQRSISWEQVAVKMRG
ncbi:MAG TPA: addiction module protein [Armatimonadota bacterium]|nr:addiction module protein [Armatimonadota bacterium]